MTKQAPAVKAGFIYNKTETAQLLGISRVTLRKYTRLQRITPLFNPLTGTEYFTAESILDAWMQRNGSRLPESAATNSAIGRLANDCRRSLAFEARLNLLRNRGE